MSLLQGVGATDLLTILHDIQVVGWMTATAHTIFLYDLIITVRDEYMYVWRPHWSIGKILYILVKYPFNSVRLVLALYSNLTPNATITLTFCKGFFMWDDFGGWVQMILVQSIIGVRTATLYNLTPKVVILISTLVCASAGASLVINIIFSFSTLYGIYPSSSPFNGCYRQCPSCLGLARFSLLPFIIFDSIMLFLTLNRYRKHGKRDLNTSLVWILYRDGFLYFAVVFTSILVTFVILNTARPSLLEVTGPLLRSLIGIICARSLLNLRCAILGKTHLERSTAVIQPKQPSASTGLGIWDAASGAFPSSGYQNVPSYGKSHHVPSSLLLSFDSGYVQDIIVLEELPGAQYNASGRAVS